MRYSNKDVENRFVNVTRLLRDLGMLAPMERVNLKPRETLDGETLLPWQVFVRDLREGMDSYYAPSWSDMGTIGWTNREAVTYLETVSRTLKAVKEHHNS